MRSFLKLTVMLLSVVLLLCTLVACGGDDITESTVITDAPETEAPETEAPETEAPETNAPETEATGDGAEVLESSMTEERIGALVGKAYFWAPSGNKIHVKSDCRSFGKGVAYAGTFDQASAVRTGGFCGICSKGASADENPLATAEILAGCYTYEDFMNGVPAWAY